MFSIYKVTIFFGNIGIFCCCNMAFLLVGFPKLLKITAGIALFFLGGHQHGELCWKVVLLHYGL